MGVPYGPGVIGEPSVLRMSSGPQVGPFASVGGGQEMGDVVLAFREHDVRAVMGDDAHVFGPGPVENGVFGIAGPMNAVARGGQPQRHGRRAVAGVAGVPETVGSVVADQDVAPLADLAVPGIASGAGEDRVFRDRCPTGQRPGARGLFLDDRPRKIARRAVP